jgi:hypothetical protein
MAFVSTATYTVNRQANGLRHVPRRRFVSRVLTGDRQARECGGLAAAIDDAERNSDGYWRRNSIEPA